MVLSENGQFIEVLTFLCDGLVEIANRVVLATNRTENLSTDHFISTLEEISLAENVAKRRLRDLSESYYGKEVTDKAWAAYNSPQNSQPVQ